MREEEDTEVESSVGAPYPEWVAGLAGLVCRIFFRRVEVVGEESVPGDRPVLFVANHNNALVDPLLVVGFLPGRPRFLAKSTLWRNPLLRPFLRLGGVIPVYRRRDPGFDAAKNDEMFGQCRRVLAAGGSIALFPEGQSHSEPALTAIKTGAARILSVEDPRVRRTVVVPVGLTFDVKSRFRSRALVRVGQPIELESSLDESTESVSSLTNSIASALEQVTLNYPSWEEARLIERASDVFLRERQDVARRTSFAERFAMVHRFITAYRQLDDESPALVQPLRRAVEEYDGLLRGLKLRDDQVATAYSLPTVGSFLARSLALLFVVLPLALFGGALNIVPYLLCGVLAGRFAHEPDTPATYKLFGGLVLYPLTWLIEGLATGAWLGPRWGVGVGLLAVAGAWGVVIFLDRLRLLWAEARAFLVIQRSRRASVVADSGSIAPENELSRSREAVRRELLRLVDLVAGSDKTPET
ncbi:MAG: 1-acyl-sn-glycerol-3-phosphate acyltransferase [Thermoanaerobaculia bacterium]|nr:1-acyl-sn-glycerol-3-phosphate acyltransferase [Thermoanaerobaculia bacterium]